MCFLLIFAWHRSSMLISHTYIILHCSLNRLDRFLFPLSAPHILRCLHTHSPFIPPHYSATIQQIRQRVNQKNENWQRAKDTESWGIPVPHIFCLYMFVAHPIYNQKMRKWEYEGKYIYDNDREGKLEY